MSATYSAQVKTLKSQIKDSTKTVWIPGLMKEESAAYAHFFVAPRASVSINASPRLVESNKIQLIYKNIKKVLINNEIKRVTSKDKQYIIHFKKKGKIENFNYLNVAFISYKLTMWD